MSMEQGLDNWLSYINGLKVMITHIEKWHVESTYFKRFFASVKKTTNGTIVEEEKELYLRVLRTTLERVEKDFKSYQLVMNIKEAIKTCEISDETLNEIVAEFCTFPKTMKEELEEEEEKRIKEERKREEEEIERQQNNGKTPKIKGKKKTTKQKNGKRTRS